MVFFFFKQKTAYEIRLSLVGSEMCIRDSQGLLGYLGQEYPAEVEVQIKRCEKEVLAAAVPRLIWRRLPVEEVHSCGLPP